MPLVTHTFSNAFDLGLFLRGGIKSGPPPKRTQGKVFGLNGLTLVFIQPSASTVTFADASGSGLDLNAILTQIRAAVVLLEPKFKDGALVLVEIAPANGVSLNLETSTALTAFGWSGEQLAGTTHTNVEYNPPDGAAPRFVDFSTTPSSDGYALIVEVA